MPVETNTRPRLIASPGHTAFFALMIFATTTGMAQLVRHPNVWANIPGGRVWLYAGLIAMEILWIVYIAWGLRSGSIWQFLWPKRPRPYEWLLDIALAALAYLTVTAAASWIGRALWPIDSDVRFLLPVGRTESVAWLLVAITAGFCEELSFRGYLQKQIAGFFGSAVFAVPLQAVLFACGHLYQGWKAALITGVIGLIFGVVAAFRGNVRAVALAHAVGDMIF